jgi:DNA-directed RNA polymerase specialized sigma24 family protein
MYRVEGLTYAEIGKSPKISMKTVEKKMSLS